MCTTIEIGSLQSEACEQCLQGLKVQLIRSSNATNIFPLAIKNSGLVATLATRLLYDLDLN